jgi:hypothetical protein
MKTRLWFLKLSPRELIAGFNLLETASMHDEFLKLVFSAAQATVSRYMPVEADGRFYYR